MSSAGGGSSSGSGGQILVKFENKSNRVKGLSFHPKRPWVLASLHNGVVQLWDYRMESLLDRFEEHDGPVRGVHFHATQPLFVSGGDDYKIKVWNYAQRRCLFNLLGHLDYIRTVKFHHEYPWVLSASDDQTLRIWNWQSRQCLTVLTGHNHYVMCAQFHPSQDLVLSASLDQTVRVWDIAGLRQKNVSIGGGALGPDGRPAAPAGAPYMGGAHGGPGGAGGQGQGGQQGELFGPADAVVKHVLEGHSRGVNWASFHKTMPLIVSGADDREVKLWRMNDVRVWEVDTMRGHINNVSCVLFHPREEVIISNSEDKTIRAWDISKQKGPRTLRRDNERYWILDAHPTKNLVAAGHDAGMLVFKLNRERPAMDTTKKDVFYYKDQAVHRYEFKTGKDFPLLSVRKRPAQGHQPHTLHYNRANRSQHCILVITDANTSAGSYELFVMGKSAAGGGAGGGAAAEGYESYKGSARSACFVSRQRFAVLDRQRQVWLKDMKNDTKRKVNVPGTTVHAMFAAGTGRLLLRASDRMILYDVQVMKVVAELPVVSRHPIKYVVWSPSHKYCAMFSKAHIYVTDGQLRELCTVNETSRVKSGAWDPVFGVFVYTTHTHIKYLLPGGDSGIIRSLDDPIYVTAASSTALWYVDRESNTHKIPIDTTEYQFKVALLKRRFKDVRRIMQSNKLVGESIVNYLQQKGFPEVALHFVQDPKVKFSLALECGNIRVALDCATELDDAKCWHRLGVEALRQGNHQVVEAAYQRTRNFERLSFLYLITGNNDKLAKMLQIASRRQDLLGVFHNALYLGSVEERVAVLRAAGHGALALLTARAHGLEELAGEVEGDMAQAAAEAAGAGEDEEVEVELPALPDVSGGRLLFPPTPIMREANWPLLEVRQGYFDQAPNEEPVSGEEYSSEEEDGDDAKEAAEDDKWLRSESTDRLAAAAGGTAAAAAAAPGAVDEFGLPLEGGADAGGAGGGGWGGGDDMLAGLGIEMDAPAAGAGADDFGDLSGLGLDGAVAGGGFEAPAPGLTRPEQWLANSSLAADAVAAGDFGTAMEMLSRQIGACDMQALKADFMAIYNTARVLGPALPNADAPEAFLERAPGLPLLPYTNAQCVEMLRAGAKAMTEGKFEAALASFSGILRRVPLLAVGSQAEEQDLKELVKVCAAYVTAIRIELERRKHANDPARQCALAAYFTRCRLKPLHLILGLKVAIKCAFAVKNFTMGGAFARRILELYSTSPNKQALAQFVNVAQIRNVVAHCEKNPGNATEIDYQDGVALELCAMSFTPIHKTDPSTESPYTGSKYHARYDLQLCPTSGFCRIGAEASGLHVFHEAK